MRVLPVYSIAFVLALLLIGTTPMGTGAGVHQFDLVHPLFAHVHIIHGQVVTHEQMRLDDAAQTNASQQPAAGPALGAGSGAGQTLAGLGISPILPFDEMDMVLGTRLSRVPLTVRMPGGRLQEAPPAPPPTLLG